MTATDRALARAEAAIDRGDCRALHLLDRDALADVAPASSCARPRRRSGADS